MTAALRAGFIVLAFLAVCLLILTFRSNPTLEEEKPESLEARCRNLNLVAAEPPPPPCPTLPPLPRCPICPTEPPCPTSPPCPTCPPPRPQPTCPACPTSLPCPTEPPCPTSPPCPTCPIPDAPSPSLSPSNDSHTCPARSLSPEEELTIKNCQTKFQGSVDKIMMDDVEVFHIISYLKPNHVMLEWGSGGSTTIYSQFVSKYYSIEHNKEWCKDVKQLIKEKGIKNINYNCHPVENGFRGWPGGFTEGSYAQFREYVDLIDSLPSEKYDVVLVDGRARISCCLKLLPHLHGDSLVFLHDVFKNRDYRKVLEYYDLVSLVFSDRGIAVLKPKAIKPVKINDECQQSPACNVTYQDGTTPDPTLFKSNGMNLFLGLPQAKNKKN